MNGLGPTMLAALIHACAAAPLPPPLDAAQIGVVEIESHGDSWAIDNDNTGQSIFPASYESALSIATFLVADDLARGRAGKGIDVGVAQIDDHEFAAHGLTVADALDPCENLAVSSTMLSGTFTAERQRFAAFPPTVRDYAALDATLQIYNSGRANGNPKYARDVLTAMRGNYATQTLAALQTQSGATFAQTAAWSFVPAAMMLPTPVGSVAPTPDSAQGAHDPNEFVGAETGAPLP